MDFRKLITIVESFLTEDLTKGSQAVFANKNTVVKLADAIRDDAMFNPSSFPAGFAKSAQKAKDEDLAKWFLEQLDRIEAEGYQGRVYSRNGVNSVWIVQRYIAGSHNWEDIEGTLNMNLVKFYTLKNRNMLDANHQDIQQFKSIRELGQYMVYHYADKLKELEQQIANAEKKKTARAIKIVDNDDYIIYIILNRQASCMYGMGSNWCTANSSYAGHYHNYAGQAMLFQLYPKNAEDVKIHSTAGKEIEGKERYQFSADRAMSFMNLADQPMRAQVIREKFPYLYSDIATALTDNGDKIQDFIEQSKADPKINQNDDTKVKEYNIQDELKKLQKFIDSGHFTNEKRPPEPEPGPQPAQIAQ